MPARRSPIFAALLLAALLAPACFARAQADSTRPAATAEVVPRYRYRVLGVYDLASGDPVEGADVIDVLSGNSVKTTSTGTASLLFMPDGGGLVRIRKIGYELQTMMIGISPTDTTPVTLVLKRLTELPAVVTIDSAPHYISAQLRGFEDRRRISAGGHFISEADLRKEDGRPLGLAMMAHIPTMEIQTGRHGAMTLKRSPHCARGGPPTIYLDGVALVNPVDLSQFEVANLAGVEYYANNATAPAEFGGTSTGCGALLLWSRQ